MREDKISKQVDFLMMLHKEAWPLGLHINTLKRITKLDSRWKPTSVHSRLVNLINHGLVMRTGKGCTLATPTGLKRKKHVTRLDGLTGIKRSRNNGMTLGL